MMMYGFILTIRHSFAFLQATPIHLSIHLPTCLSTYNNLPTLTFINLSTYLPIHLLPIYLPTYPSTCLPIHLPIYLPTLVRASLRALSASSHCPWCILHTARPFRSRGEDPYLSTSSSYMQEASWTFAPPCCCGIIIAEDEDIDIKLLTASMMVSTLNG